MADSGNTLHDEPRVALQRVARRELADEWALVLMSQGLHPRVRHDAGTWVLAVPLEEAASATASLTAYLHENPPDLSRARDRPADSDAPYGDGLDTALWVAGGLLAFFLVTGARDPDVWWFAQGSADAARILDGQWWRTVTALTLHADLLHVLSNVVLGALLLSALSGMLGGGLACTLVLLSGAAGNLVNALLQPASHVSVGASTAVFGALGVLSALAVMRRRRIGERGRRMLIPVAAGLGLLAMLGTSGERVDLWAHLLGFAAGGVVGAWACRSQLATRAQRIQGQLGMLAALTLVGCWMLALP
jgi:membrane associated rhomboid family serine protease